MTAAPTPPTPTSRRAERIALAAVLAIAGALRFLGIGWSLPNLFEEATPFRTAWEMWGFAPLRHFDLNPHWFTYPSLIFYAQMAGQALTFGLLRLFAGAHSLLDLRVRFFTDPTPYVLVARSITALFGAATVLPAWSIARRAGGPGAAALAALVVALHPDLIAKSQVIEVDVPLAFFMVLAVDRMLAARDGAGLGRWIVAGVAAGLATASKYPGLVLVAPLAVAAWWPRRESGPGSAAASPAASRAARPAGRRTQGARPPRATGATGAMENPPAPLRFAAALAALGLTFLVTSPFVVLDWAAARQQMEQARDLMTKGHFGVAGGSAYATYAHDWFSKLVGWPLGIASLAAILYFSWRRQPWALLLAAIFVPFIAVVGSWEMKADRYLLPLFPLAAVAGALGVAALSRHFLPARPRARAAAFCVASLLTLAPLVARLPAQRATLGTDTRTLARRWIENNLAPGSMVMSEVYGAEVLSPVGMQLFDTDVRGEIARRGGLARVYAVQTVPMYVMRSERSAKYYDLDRLGAADVLVISSAVRERYRGEPQRYAAQLRFYDELARRWPLAARFTPGRGPGPELSIYRNPAEAVPFALRRTVPPTDTTIATRGERSGSEAFWYFNLALNHELGGQDAAARECYLLALRFGATEPDTYVHAAVRLASLLRAEGHPGSARAMLQLCAERAPGPTQAAVLRGALETLDAGGDLATPVAR